MKKFVEKMKRFWSLNAKTNGGFTLVELIVVIAILAILAGIAVPAYSGYVEKAKKAEDEQLLATINTAFAAACIENGTDVHSVDNAAIELDTDKSVKAVTVPAAYDEAFQIFYGGNEDAKFNGTNRIIFDSIKHMFVNPASVDSVSMSYGGGYVTLSSEDVEALVDSTFLTANTLNGSAGLLDKVDYVTSIAAGMAEGQMSTVFSDPDFIQCAMKGLGVTTTEQYIAKQEELLAEMMANGMTRDQAEAKLGANAAVLYAAQNAVNFTEEQISELFSSTGIGVIKANLTTTGKTTDGMAQAALVYGMYTAYAHSNEYGNAALQSTTNDPLAVLRALESDTNFKTYINSAQGKTDLNAYIGALGMITDSADSSPDAVAHLMVNGFNNAELKDVIASATGK